MLCEHLFVSLPQSFGTYIDRELWCHTINVCLTFQGTAILLFTAAAPFTFPPMVQKLSNFSASLPAHCFLNSYKSHSNQCDKAFLIIISNMLALFYKREDYGSAD